MTPDLGQAHENVTVLNMFEGAYPQAYMLTS